MRAYAAVLSANFRTLLQYRAAAIAGFATQIFWGFIRSSTAAQPMNVDEVTTYVWLSQAFIMLLPWNRTAKFTPSSAPVTLGTSWCAPSISTACGSRAPSPSAWRPRCCGPCRC